MEISVAELSDIDEVLELHYKYHITSITGEDKANGFVTTSFTKDQITNLVTNERGLFIAREDGLLVAYAMAASWEFWPQWPMFSRMIKGLPKLKFLGRQLSTDNSYQYGPVCVDESIRGSGALEKIFDFARAKMAERYEVLVTFINAINTRSFVAHTKKLGLEIINEFEFNGNQYYELAYDTSRPVSPCLPVKEGLHNSPQSP